jgi:hypothetical protein
MKVDSYINYINSPRFCKQKNRKVIFSYLEIVDGFSACRKAVNMPSHDPRPSFNTLKAFPRPHVLR